MSTHLKMVAKVAFLTSPKSLTVKPWFPHALLGLSMGVFYLARWWAGQAPPSDKGLIFAQDRFYFYSGLMAPWVWGAMTEISARCTTFFANGDDLLLARARMAYAYPLFFWLGILEGSAWLVLPLGIFRYCALLCMMSGMMVVYIHAFRIVHTAKTTVKAHLCTGLALLPQLLLAAAFIR